MNNLDKKRIEKICKPYYEDAESVIHRWGHVERVAKSAPFFVEFLGGNKKEKELSYIAGILHDIVRPKTEKRCHAKASSNKAREILEESSEMNEREIDKISKAIEDHREPTKWESPLHQSVYLADKIFEHMGAYLDFRASVWAGELSHTDYKNKKPIEAILTYYEKASNKFLELKFPKSLEELVNHQKKWNKEYKKALENNKEWALDMGKRLFKTGRQSKDFDKTLKTFNTENKKQEEWKKEMERYIKFKTNKKPLSIIKK